MTASTFERCHLLLPPPHHPVELSGMLESLQRVRGGTKTSAAAGEFRRGSYNVVVKFSFTPLPPLTQFHFQLRCHSCRYHSMLTHENKCKGEIFYTILCFYSFHSLIIFFIIIISEEFLVTFHNIFSPFAVSDF